MVAPAHNHAENFENLQELTLWMGASFTRPHGGRLMILPVDRNAGNCLVKGSTCAPLHTSVPLRDPPQEPAKKQSGAAAADRTPTPKSVTEPPNTKSNNTQELSRNRAMFSLTVCSRTRKRKEYNLNVRTSESSLRTLIYLVTFSLLAVTDLDTWLASSRTRAIIWSLLDLGAASDSLLAKLLMHGTAQCIANLGARSLLELAS